MVDSYLMPYRDGKYRLAHKIKSESFGYPSQRKTVNIKSRVDASQVEWQDYYKGEHVTEDGKRIYKHLYILRAGTKKYLALFKEKTGHIADKAEYTAIHLIGKRPGVI